MNVIYDLKDVLADFAVIRQKYIEKFNLDNANKYASLREEFYRIYTVTVPELLFEIFALLNATGLSVKEEYDVRSVTEWITDYSFFEALQEVAAGSDKRVQIITLVGRLQNSKDRVAQLLNLINRD